MDDSFEEGQWLVEQRASLDRGEAEWLKRLAQFDRARAVGPRRPLLLRHLAGVAHHMKRSTAFEKLRVAHELERRPIVAEAFRRGDISYSAVRAITRMIEPEPEVDAAMVTLAASGTAAILDIERAVRHYMLNRDQDRPPSEDPKCVRDVRIKRGDDGTGRIVVTLSDLEVEEFAAALQAFIDLRYRPKPVDESSRADDTPPSHGFRPVDESAPEDPGHCGPTGEAPLEQASRPAQKANAFMDMVNSALSAADGGHAAGDDRYLVHIVTRHHGHSYNLLDGTPLHPHDTAIACDASTVTHTVTAEGEPLRLGRKTREWTTAQRRAITVRDGGHCRFPGCQFSHYDIHHMQSWEHGGTTDIDNGFCQCRRHHRLLHAGYQVEGPPRRTDLLPARRNLHRLHPPCHRPATRRRLTTRPFRPIRAAVLRQGVRFRSPNLHYETAVRCGESSGNDLLAMSCRST
jgi:hypothetical protein